MFWWKKLHLNETKLHVKRTREYVKKFHRVIRIIKSKPCFVQYKHAITRKIYFLCGINILFTHKLWRVWHIALQTLNFENFTLKLLTSYTLYLCVKFFVKFYGKWPTWPAHHFFCLKFLFLYPQIIFLRLPSKKSCSDYKEAIFLPILMYQISICKLHVILSLIIHRL